MATSMLDRAINILEIDVDVGVRNAGEIRLVLDKLEEYRRRALRAEDRYSRLRWPDTTGG